MRARRKAFSLLFPPRMARGGGWRSNSAFTQSLLFTSPVRLYQRNKRTPGLPPTRNFNPATSVVSRGKALLSSSTISDKPAGFVRRTAATKRSQSRTLVAWLSQAISCSPAPTGNGTAAGVARGQSSRTTAATARPAEINTRLVGRKSRCMEGGPDLQVSKVVLTLYSEG